MKEYIIKDEPGAMTVGATIERELVRCKDGGKQCTDNCLLYWNDINTPDNWYCADGVKR